MGTEVSFLLSVSEGGLEFPLPFMLTSPCSSGLGIMFSQPTCAQQGLGTVTGQIVDTLDLWNPLLQ